MAGSFIAGALFMSVQNVVADEVLMNLEVSEYPLTDEDKKPLESIAYVASGTAYDLRLEGEFRLRVLPEVRPDYSVLITVHVYNSDAEDAEPVMMPRIIVQSGSEGMIQVGSVQFPVLQSTAYSTGIQLRVVPTVRTDP